MKANTIIESDALGSRLLWKIEIGDAITVYGEHTYPTPEKAREAAALFMNKFMLDRKAWPRTFK